MLILGIDPGLDGALCFLGSGLATCRIVDMPTLSLSRSGKTRREIDPHALANELTINGLVGHAFIEQAGPRPKNGPIQAFSSGKSFGVLVGILATRGVPMTFVHPNAWKKSLAVPAAKDGAISRANQLLPHCAHWWPLKKHDGRAESALIALWGIRSLDGIARGEAA